MKAIAQRVGKWQIQPLGVVADLCLGKMLDQKKNKGELLPFAVRSNFRKRVSAH